MKKLLHLIIAYFLIHLFFIPSLQAQWQNGLWTEKQAYNWYFGVNAGINFETSPPTILQDGQTTNLGFAVEGTGVISDGEGNLLFYSDGFRIWDASHNLMPNGTGLLGDPSSTQSGLIIPNPFNENIFYVFSVNGEAGGGVFYSEVDMNLNGGLGDVTLNKNILLATGVTEKITAVHHENGDDVWVLIRKHANDEVWAFLVTEDGVNISPIVSNIGIISSDDGRTGQMKASPNGEYLAISSIGFGEDDGTQVFRFNNETGEVLELIVKLTPFELGGDPLPYGVEFSPNSNLLYVSLLFSSGIYQFDLTAGEETDIINSGVLIGSATDELQFISLQLTPHGKIYLAKHALTFPDPGPYYLGVIHNPNNTGISANYVDNSLDLEGNPSHYGLPGFIQSYFASGILYEGSECPGEAVSFSTLRIPGIESIVWDFGDGNNSTDLEPVNTFAEAGTYIVTAEITSNGAIQYATTEITILDGATATAPPVEDLTLCDNGTGEVIFDLTLFNATILDGQDPGDFTVGYFLTETDAINDENPIVDPDNFNTSGQIIYVRVTNTLTGCYTVLPIELFMSPAVIAGTPPDLSQCDEGSGEALFNLTVQDDLILDGQTAADFSITYHTDAIDADAGINAIVSPEVYVSTGQTIYARLTNDDTACYDVVSFELEVLVLPVAGIPSNLEVCDTGNGEATFDLTIQDGSILDGQNPGDFTVTYHIELADADAGINAIVSPEDFVSAGQTIFARLTHNSGGCYDVVSFELIVLPLPDANPVGDLVVCDNGTGSATFDLTLQDTGILGSQNPGDFSVTYHTELADAENGVNAIGNPEVFDSAGQTIYARVTNINTTCYSITQFDLIVEPLPLAVSLPDLEVCDSGALEGTAVFDLTVQEAIILENQTDVTIAYFLSQGDANANTNAIVNPEGYTNISNPQDIYVRVDNPDFEACYATTSFGLEVFASDLVFGSLELIGCSPFDLTRIIEELDAGLSVEFYTTPEDALTQSNALPNPESYITTSQTQTLYIRVTDSEGCADIAELRLVTGDCAIPEGISPNNDGKNDRFDLTFLTATYGSESMEIYNRNGTIVFKEANYSNQWAGQDKNGNDLPTGTYFYVLKLREAHPEFGEVISRWVYLQR